MIVGSGESADECGYWHGRTRGIHQAESDGLNKSARFFDGADGLAIKAPFFAAELVNVGFGHKTSRPL